MTKRMVMIFAVMTLITCIVALIFFIISGKGPFLKSKKQELYQTRLIIPGEPRQAGFSRNRQEQAIINENISVRAPMNEGESVISIITQDVNGDAIEEQFIAYRNLQETDGPINIGFIQYDEKSRSYKRIWSSPTAAIKPGTVSLFTIDLLGDRSVCVVLTGMNGQGEHTMTVFLLNNNLQARHGRNALTEPLFNKIAEIQIEGTIKVNELDRSQSYQLGQAPGQSFNITAYGHNPESENILDQIEVTYTYNEKSGLYERTRLVRIPGSQIEQRRVRELLSGAPGVFEHFLNDLWYHVSPQGTLDNRQYIFFDPAKKELVFYGDEAQQVFVWQNSVPTRYGLYIRCQNVSVTTLKRSVDIELESLDSVRVKVVEDVRLKLGGNAVWDGTYRRAGTTLKNATQKTKPILPYIDAAFDSTMGRLKFYLNGEYEISSGASQAKGRYVFFKVNGQELLELRPDAGNSSHEIKAEAAPQRTVYLVDRSVKTGTNRNALGMSLSRVQLGSSGILDLHEGVITLTPISNNR